MADKAEECRTNENSPCDSGSQKRMRDPHSFEPHDDFRVYNSGGLAGEARMIPNACDALSADTGC
jgi:hypothetical protein